MKELVKIEKREIEGHAEDFVSARDLYKFLGISKRFSVWAETNLKFFKEGLDFTSVLSGTLVNNGAKRELQDYLLTVDTAKHIALMSQSKKGEQIRQYFIDVEKLYKKQQEWLQSRGLARLEYPLMTQALKDSREEQGKETKHFHYSNEADMINKIVLGQTAKQYCLENNIERTNLRDSLPNNLLQIINKAQNRNTVMIELGFSFEHRKEQLTKLFGKDVIKVLKEK